MATRSTKTQKKAPARATPRAVVKAAPKKAEPRKAAAASKPARTVSKAKALLERARPQSRKTPARPPSSHVRKIVSIPDDVVLSPSSELPRHNSGQDRSTRRTTMKELSWSAFDRYVQELARSLASKNFEPDAVVGVAHGGVFVGGAVASSLQKDFYPVRISRRSRDLPSQQQPGSNKPKVSGTMPKELKGRKVLIVDDVASSGDTLELAVQLARKAGAKMVVTAALVSRPEGFLPDFTAMVTTDLVVFPWDYSEVTDGSPFEVPRV